VPDRRSKFEESKHSAKIFRLIASGQRRSILSSMEASTSSNSEFLFAKFMGYFRKSWPLACSLETFWCYMSSTSDLKGVAEGCLRRFNSHCLIERWHAIVGE